MEIIVTKFYKLKPAEWGLELREALAYMQGASIPIYRWPQMRQGQF